MLLAKPVSCSILSLFPQPATEVAPAPALCLGNVVRLDNVYKAFVPQATEQLSVLLLKLFCPVTSAIIKGLSESFSPMDFLCQRKVCLSLFS